MKIDSELMTEFVARYPAQPATAFWRGIEIDVLARAGIPEGLGLEPVIAELSRVLKPGGKFFFTVPGPGFHENLVGSVVPGFSRAKYFAALDQRLAHFNYLTEADWRAICERNGLKLTSITGYLGQATTRRWELLSRMTGGLLHGLTFGRSRPIEIRRALKLRALQDSAKFPQPIARLLAHFITRGLNWEDRADRPSCLLVIGERQMLN